MMQADDLSLALYGLKSCSTHHPKMNRILSVLRHKAHMVFAKPTQPWADYERMLPMRHAGMLPSVAHSILQQHKDKDRGHYTHEHIHSLNHNDLQEHASNPAFSMHALATALEGVRRLNRGLIGEDRRGNEQAQITLQRVQELQATLLTKLQYTDAPLNLTHLSLFLNAIRYAYVCILCLQYIFHFGPTHSNLTNNIIACATDSIPPNIITIAAKNTKPM